MLLSDDPRQASSNVTMDRRFVYKHTSYMCKLEFHMGDFIGLQTQIWITLPLRKGKNNRRQVPSGRYLINQLIHLSLHRIPQRTKQISQLARNFTSQSTQPSSASLPRRRLLFASFPTSYTDRRRHQPQVDSHTSLTTYTSSQLTASFASSRVLK